MPLSRLLTAPPQKAGLWLALLIGFQTVCALFFVGDVIVDLEEGEGTLWHLLPEFGATLGLVIAIVVEALVLAALLRRQAHMARSLGVAAGALNEVMLGHFRRWGLTPSEQDVAAFTIKGFSIAEIATLRGSAEGTVKTHLNAIYRKSGVQGRGQLVSLLIDDLLDAPLLRADRQDPAENGPRGAGAAAAAAD